MWMNSHHYVCVPNSGIRGPTLARLIRPFPAIEPILREADAAQARHIKILLLRAVLTLRRAWAVALESLCILAAGRRLRQ